MLKTIHIYSFRSKSNEEEEEEEGAGQKEPFDRKMKKSVREYNLSLWIINRKTLREPPAEVVEEEDAEHLCL